MRVGIEVSPGIYVSYKKIVGLDGDKVILDNGDSYYVTYKESLQRIRNYIITGHPVLDEVGPLNEEGYGSD